MISIIRVMRLHTAAIGSAALLIVLGVPVAAMEAVTIRTCYDGDT